MTETEWVFFFLNTVYVGDSSNRGQGRQAWTAVGLLPPPRYPKISQKIIRLSWMASIASAASK